MAKKQKIELLDYTEPDHRNESGHHYQVYYAFKIYEPYGGLSGVINGQLDIYTIDEVDIFIKSLKKKIPDVCIRVFDCSYHNKTSFMEIKLRDIGWL